ncbi:MAG: DUF3179 domain-containing protein [Rhizobiaceae bacterium]
MKIVSGLKIAAVGLTLSLGMGSASSAEAIDVGELSKDAIFGHWKISNEAADKLAASGRKDAIAALLQTARVRQSHPRIMKAISTLAGEEFESWNDGMIWQESHPEIKPHSSYRVLKRDFLNRIDPSFDRFLGEERSLPKKMKIRLEEITWGGVAVDGIPALDNPKLVEGAKADYLIDSDLVFGVKIKGDVRAYPLRIMGWHEMFNETIGGVPVALAYCTLCGAGILFETKIEGRKEPLVFGSSGLLYRSNKLMFDRETDSLWNQFTGEPVVGPLAESGIKLKIRPVTITTWERWFKSNPDTKVLSTDTGFKRNYASGVVYNEYFSSPDLMFPVAVKNEERVKRKDYVFGIRSVAAAKAWPLEVFGITKLINDKVGTLNVVLLGDKESRTVRAYQRGELEFALSDIADQISADGDEWKIEEEFLISPNGKRLPRVPGHISYWFAWDGYLGVKSKLYSSTD